jgi:hypothetical protein
MTVMNAWPGEDEPFDKDKHVWMISEPEIDEISCVPAGDNPLARIMLIKAREGRETVRKAEAPELPSGEEIRAEVDSAVSETLERDPSMSPAQAWRETMQTDRARGVRRNYVAALDAHVEAEQDAVLGARATQAQRVSQRADALRKEAAAFGAPITQQEAFKRAMRGE